MGGDNGLAVMMTAANAGFDAYKAGKALGKLQGVLYFLIKGTKK